MISHRIEPTHELVISTWTGAVSDESLLDGYRRLYEDPDWRVGYGELADLREADLTGVTSKGLAALARLVGEYVKETGQVFKTAVVVSADVNFGLARVYEAYSEESPEKVRVFREPGPALAWLGAPEDVLGD